MNDEATIGGSVENGNTGVAVFPFYTGPVGIRDRGDWWDVAFFAASVRPRLPVKGMIDGQPVMITAIRSRELTPGAAGGRDALRAITATVVPSLSG